MKLLTILSSLLALANATHLLQQLLTNFQNELPPSVNLVDYNYTETHNLSDKILTELFSLHKWLVSTPSVSYHELEVGKKLGNYLTSKGLTVEYQKVSESRYNVFAYKGTKNTTKILVNSHIDTVPPYFPYSLSEDGTKIFGRGSTDAKGSVSAEVIAFLELYDSLEEGEVALLFDVGEEKGGDGIHYINETTDYHWNSLIVGEPTENKLGIGHKGAFGASINVTGKAAHSGYPELGISANDILIEFLHHLKKKELPYDELLGNSTLNIGILTGGIAKNVISPIATADAFFRVASQIEKFPDILRQAIEETEGGENINLTINLGHGPLYFDYQVDGFESIVLGYGTDASGLTKNEIPHKFLYGPGSIHVAHGAGEYIDTDSLIAAVEGYKRLIKHTLSL